MVDNVIKDFTLLVRTISWQGAVHCSIHNPHTVQCSDRGAPVRDEVVVVSQLSMNLKAKLNRLQIWVSDALDGSGMENRGCLSLQPNPHDSFIYAPSFLQIPPKPFEQ